MHINLFNMRSSWLQLEVSFAKVTNVTKKKAGGDLLSHNLHAVPSTQQNLTTEFGMGSGVSSVL